jgi:hypothetical protein
VDLSSCKRFARRSLLYPIRVCHNTANFAAWEQENHQTKLRKPLPEVVDFEIADWMFSCESLPPFRALLDDRLLAAC